MHLTNLIGGRELDVLVAENVFKHTVWRNVVGGWSLGSPIFCGERIINELPLYSESLPMAWQVLDKLGSLGFKFVLGTGSSPLSVATGRPWIAIGRDLESSTAVSEGDFTPFPYLICIAALRAVGVPIPIRYTESAQP